LTSGLEKGTKSINESTFRLLNALAAAKTRQVDRSKGLKSDASFFSRLYIAIQIGNPISLFPFSVKIILIHLSFPTGDELSRQKTKVT
jgi:hypothetical protein